jgi:hypothetical protein
VRGDEETDARDDDLITDSGALLPERWRKT